MRAHEAPTRMQQRRAMIRLRFTDQDMHAKALRLRIKTDDTIVFVKTRHVSSLSASLNMKSATPTNAQLD